MTSKHNKENKVFVRTNVKRDLLQSAALFKTEHQVVWEYVSNGLQYVNPGVNPTVLVKINERGKSISIHDNGRGMSYSDLDHFFCMHGENLERKAGRAGRGMFGTGKSAAFGIATTLTVHTIQNGKKTVVRLSRNDIESMPDGGDIPVETLEIEASCDDPDGTQIEISGIHFSRIDKKRIINYIERQLARWPRGVSVMVNNHECQYVSPISIRTLTLKPSGSILNAIGDCVLTLHQAARPLSEDERGVSIFSNGVWHETTLAGSDGKEMANHIFGEIDVSALDSDDSPVAPYDMSRSMKLNPANSVVQSIYAFIGISVENLRKELVKEERERKKSDLAKNLANKASEIAEVINQDFNEFKLRVSKSRAKARGGVDIGKSTLSNINDDEDFIFGTSDPAEVEEPMGGLGAQGNTQTAGEIPRELNPVVRPGKPESPKHGKKVGGEGNNARKPHGGFTIEFRNMGKEEYRAKYNRDERQIVINLDHPQFAAALRIGTTEDPTFLRLAYEVAFTEYALALALELAQRDEYLDITDPIVDIGDTINRVARRAASLYDVEAR